MAMNGWAEGEPAWWLNLQAQPDVDDRAEGRLAARVRGPPAEGEERDRLWAMWRTFGHDQLDGYSTRRSQTAVVVLEPAAASPIDAPAGRRVDSYPTKSLGYRGPFP